MLLRSETKGAVFTDVLCRVVTALPVTWRCSGCTGPERPNVQLPGFRLAGLAVKSRLERIYRKLGVNGRAALAAEVARH